MKEEEGPPEPSSDGQPLHLDNQSRSLQLGQDAAFQPPFWSKSDGIPKTNKKPNRELRCNLRAGAASVCGFGIL